MCGKNLSQSTVSTVGEQKKFNYALQPMTLDAFRLLVTADQPEAPEYFVYDAIKNRQERPDLSATMSHSLRGLTVAEVLELRTAGAQLLDVREALDFEGAHLRGAINIGLKGKYATWCGSVLDHERPIVVIAESGNEAEAVTRLGRIGFDNVTGYLAGGMASLAAHPEQIATVPRMTAGALAAELEGSRPPLVVDVRSEKEWNQGHVAGSVNLPLPHLHERLAELPSGRDLVVHCEGGYRSAIACSLLVRAGRAGVHDLVGGLKAWQASQLPVEVTAGAAPTCGTTSCSAGKV